MVADHPYNHHLCHDFVPTQIHTAFCSIVIVKKRFSRGLVSDKILHQNVNTNIQSMYVHLYAFWFRSSAVLHNS